MSLVNAHHHTQLCVVFFFLPIPLSSKGTRLYILSCTLLLYLKNKEDSLQTSSHTHGKVFACYLVIKIDHSLPPC